VTLDNYESLESGATGNESLPATIKLLWPSSLRALQHSFNRVAASLRDVEKRSRRIL
jgi:hypothetical protein